MRIATKIMLWLIVATTTFHLGIVFRVIPYEVAWGGRLKTNSEIYVFEIISIIINTFFCIILLMKAGYINQIIPERIVNLILWVFLVLFGLNTFGNVLAKTNFEKIFVILTFSSAILIWIILKAKNKKHETKD